MDIWFQDEARIGQQNTTTRLWAEKGTRPRAIRQQQFVYAYIFGATCAATKQAIGLVLPHVNTEAMQQHMQIISEQIPENRHALIIVDGASWHNDESYKAFDNITLLKLPPYSPELNPIEQVWQYLRQNYLANQAFKDYEQIVESCCDAWNNFAEKTEVVASITQREWVLLE